MHPRWTATLAEPAPGHVCYRTATSPTLTQ